MAPGKPVGAIKVKVPRHNAQKITAKLREQVDVQANASGFRTDVHQSSHEMAQAIESASEWNSLLLTARAERGPQWDVGTQQFQVEEYSELYYDPTALRDSAQKQFEEENGPSEQEQQEEQQRQAQQSFHLANSHNTPLPNRHPVHPGHSPHVAPPVNYPYPNSPRGPYDSPMRGPPGPLNGMMPNQYNTPMRGPGPMPASLNPMAGGFDPRMSMGTGGGMSGIGGMPMGGNMIEYGNNPAANAFSSPMGMGLGTTMGSSMMPGPNRRMTRGMTESEYGMH